MPNQALAFHRVSTHVFDLTGLRTGSVRDQLLRSSLLVQCLADEKYIGPSRRLLIFGGGAAGINAAITAAHAGVSVDLIEKQRDPFASFRLASWRRIDPVEYDWPHPHYTNGVFPNTGAGIPLVQQSGTGADLAQVWAAEWQWWDRHRNGVAGRGKVSLLTATDAQWFKPGLVDGAAHVAVTGPWSGPAALPSTRTYGAVLSCVGFGPERTSDDQLPGRWGGYVGPAFWLDDDGVSTGRSSPFSATEVVISGGGDGGMQDFQRVTTGEFGKELLHALVNAAAALTPAVDVQPDRLLRHLLQAEDAGRRAYAWQRSKQPISIDMLNWHRSFADEVDALFTSLNQASPTHVADLADALLRPALLAGSLSVTWLYRDPTPGYAYALNRFLCLVVEHLSAHRTTRVKVMPQNQLIDIAPSSTAHKCVSPQGCLGVPHDVVIESDAGVQTILIGADLIIVRHGVLPDPLLAGPPVAEQMTPYDFPR